MLGRAREVLELLNSTPTAAGAPTDGMTKAATATSAVAPAPAIGSATTSAPALSRPLAEIQESATPGVVARPTATADASPAGEASDLAGALSIIDRLNGNDEVGELALEVEHDEFATEASREAKRPIDAMDVDGEIARGGAKRKAKAQEGGDEEYSEEGPACDKSGKAKAKKGKGRSTPAVAVTRPKVWSAKVAALLQSLGPILEKGECAIVFSNFGAILKPMCYASSYNFNFCPPKPQPQPRPQPSTLNPQA